jgi:hypothetical protein
VVHTTCYWENLTRSPFKNFHRWSPYFWSAFSEELFEFGSSATQPSWLVWQPFKTINYHLSSPTGERKHFIS